MSNIIRADDFGSDPSRRARRDLERITDQAKLGHAALEARLGQELTRAIGSEQVAQAQAFQRIKGGYDLADHATLRATHLNTKINQSSRDNPGLEMTLRDIEGRTALGAGITIFNYMARPES